MEFKPLTSAELYAFELMARRERAKAQAQVLQAGARWIASAFKAIFSRGPTAARVRRQVVHHAYE